LTLACLGQSAFGKPVVVESLASPVRLTEGWRMNFGDRAEWAAPELDERNWANYQPGNGTGDTGGFRWYRCDLRIPYWKSDSKTPTALGLSILGAPDECAYELFVNGVFVGRFGELDPVPRPPVEFRARVYSIPESAIRPDGNFVIAIRLWRADALAGASCRKALSDVRIGGVDALNRRLVENRLMNSPAEGIRLVLSSLFILVGIYHFILFRRLRKQREYFWFGLLCFSWAFNTVFISETPRFFFSNYVCALISQAANHVNLFAATLFIWGLCDRKLGVIPRAYCALQVVLFILRFLFPVLTVNCVVDGYLFNFSVFPVVLICGWVIFSEGRRGNQSARGIWFGAFWVILGELTTLIPMDTPTLTFINRTGPTLGFTGFVMGMMLVLANRLVRLNMEMDTLNRELENKVEARTREIAQKNSEIIESIQYAERIQQALLPPDRQLRQALPDHFVLYFPRDIVSGDFYWHHQTPEHHFIAVADATGHGVPGALMTIIGHDALNQIVVEQRETEPERILELLDGVVRRALKQDELGASTDDGMDLALCRISADRREVVFAGAGRPLWLMAGDEWREIKGDRKGIGGRHPQKRKTFSRHELKLERATVFFLGTDGFSDQPNEAGKKYGSTRLKELLKTIAALPFARQLEILKSELVDHRGAETQRDDITILGFRLTPKSKDVS
jgi:serine phosphatase RsbU (regulator of sigma subunit)